MALSNKIMLKETTKMSLHERFTVYRKQSQLQQQIQKQQLQMGAQMDVPSHSLQQQQQQQQQQRLQQQRFQRQATIKNQRLALQMANRPSVQAALKLKKRSLRQRLGQGTDGTSNIRGNGIKSRLSLQFAGSRNRVGGFQSGRNAGGRGGRIQGFRTGRYVQRGGLRASGTSPMLKGRLGPGSAASRNRNTLTPNRRAPFRRGRGGGQRTFGRAGFARGGFRQQGQQGRLQSNRGRGRGGKNNTRGGRGGFRRADWNRQGKAAANNNNKTGSPRGSRNPSKQDLDNDLDEYMAKTKSHLDAELDAYMAGAN